MEKVVSTTTSELQAGRDLDGESSNDNGELPLSGRLLWTQAQAKHVFQRHRLWPSFCGAIQVVIFLCFIKNFVIASCLNLRIMVAVL